MNIQITNNAPSKVVYDFGAEIVRCPKCGSRTHFEVTGDYEEEHTCGKAVCGFVFTVET